MNLKQAMRVVPGECIAFTGAGGKTTAIFTLAREINGPVLVTTTTHFGIDQLPLADQNLQISITTDVNEVINNLSDEILLLWGESDEQSKVSGISEYELHQIYLAAREREITLLVEADGSRQLPLKAPAHHEPVIPPYVDRVVVVAGLSGFGKPLNEKWVHRIDQYAEISRLDYGEPIEQSAFTAVLKDPDGGLKGIPENAGRVVLLNQADNLNLQAQGNRIANQLTEDYDSVIVASLLFPDETLDAFNADQSMRGDKIFAVHEPIAVVILAAGKAERMGRTKQLLPWKGRPLLWHVAQSAFEAGMKEVLIVVGADGENIRKSMPDLDVHFVNNPDWQQGQSTSLKKGLLALQPGFGGVIFMLADQPQVSPTLLRALIEKHASTLAPIVAPIVDGKRGNPVLFDRITFDELKMVQGDQGGREIFSRYPIEWVEWHDASVLTDIDTKEDYQRLLAGEFKN